MNPHTAFHHLSTESRTGLARFNSPPPNLGPLITNPSEGPSYGFYGSAMGRLKNRL